MPPPAPRPGHGKPTPGVPGAPPSSPGTPGDVTTSSAASIDHDASAPGWTHKFEDGWKMLGDLFRGQFRQPASGVFKDSEERDWWLIRGNIARISRALEQQNHFGLVIAMEGFLRDLGVQFTADQMRAVARAINLAADTLPLVSPSPETKPPALPNEREKE